MSLAEQETDAAIAKAANNAESKRPGWIDAAVEYVRRFPLTRFQAEQVREYAHNNGLAEPPHPRAWGAVMRKAKKLNIIQYCGYERKPSLGAHGTPAVVWSKSIQPSL